VADDPHQGAAARRDEDRLQRTGPNSPDLNQPPYAPSPIEIKAGQGEAPTEQNLQSFLVDPEGDAIIVGGFESQLPSRAERDDAGLEHLRVKRSSGPRRARRASSG
jgi:hypothetical protein